MNLTELEMQVIAELKPDPWGAGAGRPGWAIVADRAPDSVIAGNYEDDFGCKPPADHTRAHMVAALTAFNDRLIALAGGAA